MTPAVRIELPGLVRGKGRPRRGKGGHVYTDTETESYEGALRTCGRAAMGGRDPLKGPLAIAVLAVFPVPPSWSERRRAAALAGALRPTGRPDFDNILKTIDALNGVAWGDDAQVVRCVMDKVYGAQPRLVIDVYLPGGGAP